MAETAGNINVPSVEETAYQVARIDALRYVVDTTKALPKAPRPEASSALYDVAEDLLVFSGERIDEHAAYPGVMFWELDRLLPTPKFIADPNHKPAVRSQNARLAQFIGDAQELPPPRRSLPASLRHKGIKGYVVDFVERQATIDGLRRVGLVERDSKKRRLHWPVGVIAAAAFYEADIRSELGRAVYENWEEIAERVRLYQAVKVPMTGKGGYAQFWKWAEAVSTRLAAARSDVNAVNDNS